MGEWTAAAAERTEASQRPRLSRLESFPSPDTREHDPQHIKKKRLRNYVSN